MSVRQEGEETSRRLPPAFAAVAVSSSQEGPIRLAVVVQRESDPVQGHLVALRERADAMVYLGCVIDRADAVLQWVELWVQRVGCGAFLE